VKNLNVLAVTVAMLFMPIVFAGCASHSMHDQNYVEGQKLDSGLGELTQEEIDRVVAAAQPTAAASDSRSRFLAMRVPPSNEGE
jgi:outer membrane murein-binding lipoprotein Lpp